VEEIVHLCINKGYASGFILDPIRAQALEPVTENDTDIPEWQKEPLRQSLRQVKERPEQLQARGDIIKQ